MAEAIVYLKSGALTMTVLTDADNDVVDDNWEDLNTNTPGLLSDGTPVTYAQFWSPATLNDAKTAVIGGFWPNTAGTTYGAPPVVNSAIIEPLLTLALANGANNNIAGLGNFNVARIIGPTAAFSITGIVAANNGAILTFWNTTAYQMTIANASGSSSASNRITTGTGSDIIVPGKGAIQLIYSSGDSSWLAVVPGGATRTAIPAITSAASGAIAIPSLTEAVALISYSAGIGAYTIIPPVAGGPGVGDDGKILNITSLSARAHVITQGTVGFNAKAASGTLTFGGAIGDSARLLAYNGNWYLIGNVNATAA